MERDQTGNQHQERDRDRDREAGNGDAAARAVAVTAELTAVLLDDLVPMIEWYRTRLGIDLGLDPAAMLCLDVLRVRGSASSSQMARRTGLTRSAVAKLAVRLEAAGHLVRDDFGPGQEAWLRAVPHATRDARLADARAEVSEIVGSLVSGLGLLQPLRRETAVGVLAALARHLEFGAARRVEETVAAARVAAARRLRAARREEERARERAVEEDLERERERERERRTPRRPDVGPDLAPDLASDLAPAPDPAG